MSVIRSFGFADDLAGSRVPIAFGFIAKPQHLTVDLSRPTPTAYRLSGASRLSFGPIKAGMMSFASFPANDDRDLPFVWPNDSVLDLSP
jgi:hypothetical protein